MDSEVLAKLLREEAELAPPAGGLPPGVKRRAYLHRASFLAFCFVALCGVGSLFVLLRPSGAVDPEVGPASTLSSTYEFEPYPGSQWYEEDGDPLPPRSGVVAASLGPAHCELEELVLLNLGWPLGTDSRSSAEALQFVRDPGGVVSDETLESAYDEAASLPKNAEYTGYHTDFMELWLQPGDVSAAYLVFSEHVEQWPRSTSHIGCR